MVINKVRSRGKLRMGCRMMTFRENSPISRHARIHRMNDSARRACMRSHFHAARTICRVYPTKRKYLSLGSLNEA